MHDQAIKLSVWQAKSSNENKKVARFSFLLKFFYLLTGLLVAFLLVLLITRVSGLNISIMPIQHIEIRNELLNSRAMILKKQLSVLQGQSFLSVDLNTVQEKIKQLDWVEQVYISRQWPDRLMVEVVEAVPLAIWKNKKISQHGAVFEQDDVEKLLPVFNTPENKIPATVDVYLKLQNEWLAQGIYIHKVDMDERGAVKISLDNNIKIVLGTQNILHRNQLAMQIVKIQNISNKTIDMRYENGFAISEADLTHKR